MDLHYLPRVEAAGGSTAANGEDASLVVNGTAGGYGPSGERGPTGEGGGGAGGTLGTPGQGV